MGWGEGGVVEVVGSGGSGRGGGVGGFGGRATSVVADVLLLHLWVP